MRLHTRLGSAGVLVFALLAGPVQAQPAPRPLSILDVPFISQSELLCGGAAAAMVLRYWGERGLTAESFAHLVDHSAAGIRTTSLIDDLRRRRWNATAVEGTEALVAEELSRGRPVVTLIEDRPGAYHYVVVVAATPQAIVFHDPARAPFRVMDRGRFVRRWSAAGRWMAIIVPPSPATPGATAERAPVAAATSCAGLIAAGVQQAQSNQLEAAERSLASALSCGGAEPLRELAGLRLLQRRWNDVSDLASAALAEDPGDTHAWELLATSRFVQNDPDGALEAWNRLGRPRIDLVSVAGLTRTRQRAVERLLAVPPEALLTPRLFDLTARRLDELPSAVATRLEFVPRASGVAEIGAHVTERALLPSGKLTYAALGLMAAARREVAITTGSLTGGGERIRAGWRFWPRRPRFDLAMTAPAPWGGLWGVDAFGERQEFTSGAIPPARHSGAGMTVSNWVNPWLRLSARGGADQWDALGSLGTASGAVRAASRRERVVIDAGASGWAGPRRFAQATASIRTQSSVRRRGLVFHAGGGASLATAETPPDAWFGGDTGRARPVPLRAHPVTDEGRLRMDQIGRRLVHASIETRHWWSVSPLLDLGAAAFGDAARVSRRLEPGARGDLDAGIGLRLAVRGIDGVFRLDAARGLRDGATALSFVYEP